MENVDRHLYGKAFHCNPKPQSMGPLVWEVLRPRILLSMLAGEPASQSEKASPSTKSAIDSYDWLTFVQLFWIYWLFVSFLLS